MPDIWSQSSSTCLGISGWVTGKASGPHGQNSWPVSSGTEISLKLRGDTLLFYQSITYKECRKKAAVNDHRAMSNHRTLSNPLLAVFPPWSMDHVLCKLPQQERDYSATQVSLPITYSLPDNKVTTERTAKTHIQEEQDIYRWNGSVQFFFY